MTETQNSVRLGEIIKEFHLELLHEGEDYQNIPLRTLDVNRPGLPLSGFFEHFDTKRLLVMGLTETTYVSGMSEERRRESFDRLLSYPVPALIYTRGIDPFPECMEMAQKYGRTVLRTQEQTSAFMSSLIGSLYNHLAPRITRSGVMMEIYGEGVLFQGESGVGKSEVAIELIKRGPPHHRGRRGGDQGDQPWHPGGFRPGADPPLHGAAGHRGHRCTPPVRHGGHR